MASRNCWAIFGARAYHVFMRTTEVGPALARYEAEIHAAVERLVQDVKGRIDVQAERIRVQAALDADDPVEIPGQLIATRMMSEYYKAVRALMTVQIGEGQWKKFSNAQLAAALNISSPSNVRTQYPTAEVRRALDESHAQTESRPVSEWVSHVVRVDGWAFDVSTSYRFEDSEDTADAEPEDSELGTNLGWDK